MSSQHPMGRSSLENRKLTRNISAALTQSIFGWWMFEPHLARYADITNEDLQGAFLAAALEMARLVVKNIKIPDSHAGDPSFLMKHCNHPYHFPSAPAEFIGTEILKRLSHEEWAALATAFIVPGWLEQAIIEWAQSQNLTFNSQPGAKP